MTDTSVRPPDVQKPKTGALRCAVCNKKLLIVIDCECGETLCIRHRGDDYHLCMFRKNRNKEPLPLEKVDGSKLEKI